MKSILKRSYVANSVIAGSVIGYPLASVLSNLVGADNQTVAITMRAIIVALAAILFLGRMGVHSRSVGGLLAVFWTAYLLRLTYTFGVAHETASEPASTFFIWTVGVCLIPSVAILLYSGRINFAKTGLIIALLGSVAMIGIFLLGGTSIETDQGVVADQNRWNLSTINPITIGHLGASLVLIASAALLFGKSSGREIGFYTLAALIGMAGLFLANSRGPFVGMVIAIGLYGLAQIRSRRIWRFIIVIALTGVVGLYQYSDAIFSEQGLFDRFASLSTGKDASAQIRNDLYTDALAQFANAPLIGDGVEVRTYAYYPHNVVLEAFMTTGIIGGTAFLLLTLLSLRAAFEIIKFEPQQAVIALLAVQYIIAAQVSGAIYQSGAMWVLMAGVLSFSIASKRVRTDLVKQRLVRDASDLPTLVTIDAAIPANQNK